MLLILDQDQLEFSRRLRDVAERGGMRALLLTSAEIARDLVLDFHITDQGVSLLLCLKGTVIQIGDIEGVYCGINTFEPKLWECFSPEDAEYAARETQALWLAILASLPCRVMNPPALDALAGTLLSTPEVFFLAHRLGFHIPMVITLESGRIAAELLAENVQAFYADLGKNCINETALPQGELVSLAQNEDAIRVKEELLGKPVYVTLIGDQIFACTTDSAGVLSPLAARQLPSFVRNRLHALCRQMHLSLAEFSFRVMVDGTWIFSGCGRPPTYAVAAYGDNLFTQIIKYVTGKRE